jgi:hypothetical protein
MFTEPEDGTVVLLYGVTLQRGAPPEIWQRRDAETDGDRRWVRLDKARSLPLSWTALRRRGRPKAAQEPADEPAGESYPTCSSCGHHTSAVLAGQCTVFVPCDPVADGAWARYCNCRCVDDPAVRAWLERSNR